MNRIEFPRISYNGDSYSKEDIEDWYWQEIRNQNIESKLNGINCENVEERKLLEYINKNLKCLILASPVNLEEISKDLLNTYSNCLIETRNNKEVPTKFNKEILDSFDYKSNRKTLLLELAERLNIKVCPYCNLNYTLFIEKKMSRKLKKMAKFQFDHFFSKDRNPFLSMSLYNLIPSCSVCNQAKSTKPMALNFHPYVSAIHEHFRFKVDNPVDLWTGSIVDHICIKLVPLKSNIELKEYEEQFNLEMQYGRHKDIVEEIYDKVYLKPYYSNPDNFKFMNLPPLRLLLGTYTDEHHIEKRPLTKFIQDIWEQANEEII